PARGVGSARAPRGTSPHPRPASPSPPRAADGPARRSFPLPAPAKPAPPLIGASVEPTAHSSPPAFVAVRWTTLFSWYGVSSGCFASTSAATPATCGAAKLLPVQRSVLPPGH